MNLLDVLPDEILGYIILIQRTAAANTIQRCWKKSNVPKVVLASLFEDLAEADDAFRYWHINAMAPETTQVMKFALKVLSGKEDKNIWLKYFAMIQAGLSIDYYTGGPGTVYYNQTENTYFEIMRCFGVSIQDTVWGQCIWE